MRAIVLRAHGGPDVLEVAELPTPTPSAHEVRVRVEACGLNHLDLWVRGGLPNLKLPLPHVLGGDVAGVVDAIGAQVDGVREGDRVLLNPGVSCGVCRPCLEGRDNFCRHYSILGEHRHGGNAEYVVAPAANVARLPAGLSFIDAACLPIPALTAWQMVAGRARVRPNEVVLVQGGASGVGVMLIQIARLHGAAVFATASTEEKRAACLALGAEQVFDSAAEDLVQQLKAATGRPGLQVVFEHIGTATWDRSVGALAYGGRLVTCGATTGYDARIDLRVLFWKQISLMGSTMGSKADLLSALDAVAAGHVKPVVDCVLPPTAVAEGHRHLAERAQIGKVVFSGAWG